MKKKSSLSILLALVLTVTVMFTGCSGNEMKIYNALEKSQDITSMESITDVSFNFEATGLEAEDQKSAQEVTNLFKDSKIQIRQKMNQNKEKNINKTQMDMDFAFGGMQMNTQLWVDADLSKNPAKLVEIIKLPPIAMMAAPAELQNKEYMVYDFSSAPKEDGLQNMDMSKFMKSMQDLQPTLASSMKKFATEFDPGFKMVTDKGTKTIDGQTVSVYELKFDDKSFKKFLRYSVDNLMKNKDASNFIKEYMLAVTDVAQLPDTEKAKAKEEITKGLNEIDLSEASKEFHAFMDKFENVKIIGDKGIVLEYAINNDGYIVNQAGTIDLNLDLNALEKTFGESPEQEAAKKGLLKIEIHFNQKIFNINKNIEISLPKLTDQNSFSYLDMAKANKAMLNANE